MVPIFFMFLGGMAWEKVSKMVVFHHLTSGYLKITSEGRTQNNGVLDSTAVGIPWDILGDN